MNLDQIEKVRRYELDLAVSEFTKGAVVLEIGAGAGFQARWLSEMGFSVYAIDIPQSNYRNNRIWPVQDYNGQDIPFPDNHFDIVFSSNVLEHIEQIKSFQYEIQRVLKPHGLAIHVVPTSSWRIWTSVAHYPYLFKIAVQFIINRFRQQTHELALISDQVTSQHKIVILRAVLFPHRHGENGNFMSEIYYFSQCYWTGLFKNHGWKIRKIYPSHLCYTGYSVLGDRLSFRVRHLLSKVCGSACRIFVLST